MPGRRVQRLWLKGSTGESTPPGRRSPPQVAPAGSSHAFSHFSDDHVKFFCFQVLEHQIKFR